MSVPLWSDFRYEAASGCFKWTSSVTANTVASSGSLSSVKILKSFKFNTLDFVKSVSKEDFVFSRWAVQLWYVLLMTIHFKFLFLFSWPFPPFLSTFSNLLILYTELTKANTLIKCRKSLTILWCIHFLQEFLKIQHHFTILNLQMHIFVCKSKKCHKMEEVTEIFLWAYMSNRNLREHSRSSGF